MALIEAVFRLGKANFHAKKNREMTKFWRQPKYKLTLSENSRIHSTNAQHEGTLAKLLALKRNRLIFHYSCRDFSKYISLKTFGGHFGTPPPWTVTG